MPANVAVRIKVVDVVFELVEMDTGGVKMVVRMSGLPKLSIQTNTSTYQNIYVCSIWWRPNEGRRARLGISSKVQGKSRDEARKRLILQPLNLRFCGVFCPCIDRICSS